MDEIDEDDFDRLETEERQPEYKPKTGFALSMDACGLSTEEAMRYLGQSRSAIEKKRAGTLPATFEDGRAFSRLWHDVRAGRIEKEFRGPFAMASTMLILTGRKAPEAARRGRPPIVPRDCGMTPVQMQRHQADIAMKAFLSNGGRAPDEKEEAV